MVYQAGMLLFWVYSSLQYTWKLVRVIMPTLANHKQDIVNAWNEI